MLLSLYLMNNLSIKFEMFKDFDKDDDEMLREAILLSLS